MAISKKSTKINRYMLSGAQKKSGVNTWRYVFTGVENTTGQERRFFIELSMLNPFLSPSEPVLGYKNRVKIQPEDLQNVLAGTISAQKLETENIESDTPELEEPEEVNEEDMWEVVDSFPIIKETYTKEEIIEKEYIKNLTELFNDYATNMHTTLSNFWNILLCSPYNPECVDSNNPKAL